jgi:Acetyltransferase (GNAT) family
MTPIGSVNQIFEMIQKVKMDASEFCTNFFPSQTKLEEWIEHSDLTGELRSETIFFFKNDRDFNRLFFCAASLAALRREITALSDLQRERIVVDLVGKENSLNDQLELFEYAGFRCHTNLHRMTRIGQTDFKPATVGEAPVVYADQKDCGVILELLERSFDRYSEQIPPAREIELAIANRQILIVRRNNAIAGLLYFETQGLTSAVRFWVVAEPFRRFKLGSALMYRYFAIHNQVRRFILWVVATNENAIEKYRHFGYAPDGLVDHVLVNKMIRP